MSWYKQQGYDDKLIEAKCFDTMEHEVFGTVYKVSLLTESNATVEEKGRKQIMSMKENKGKRKVRDAGSGSDEPGRKKAKQEVEEANAAAKAAKEAAALKEAKLAAKTLEKQAKEFEKQRKAAEKKHRQHEQLNIKKRGRIARSLWRSYPRAS